ncbi:MAG: hypothetical protein QM483_03030 [Desulfuromusa sp.]
MKRLLAVIAIMLFFGGGVLALIWFGIYFVSYASTNQRLSVESPTPQKLSLGTKTVINLQGRGFNRETSASLFLDVNNNKAVVGSFPLDGIYYESLLHGDFLYLASEHGGLQVLNLKEPQYPRLTKVYLVGRSIINITRSGTALYLSCGELGVSIMQILQNGLLQHVADIAIESHALACQVFNGFLYIAAGKSGLLIYDIRQPQQAKLVRVVRPGSFISKLVVSGSSLYLPVAGNKVEIYQLAEPQLPHLTGTLQLAEEPYDLIAHQQRLYIATENEVLSYDITTARQPQLLHQWTDFGSAKKLFAGLDHIYISDSFSGLRVIGCGVDGFPDYVNLNIDPLTLSATADYLYVAGSNKGLLIIDKSMLMPRQVIQTFNTSGMARDLLIKKNWLYVADGRGGVVLRNLEDEDATFMTLTPRWGGAFAVRRELLFVAQAKKGIEVFDISDPGKPKLVTAWPELQAMRLAVSGNYLLLSKGISGIELVDISDIQHPISKDLLPNVHPLDITADGKLVYIASKKQGLLVYEIKEDEKLNRLSRLQTPYPMNQFDLAVAVQVQAGIAYVANGNSGLLIVDVSKPKAPFILNSIAIPGLSKAVKVVGNKAFITSHLGGISIINIEDPEKLILLASIPMLGLSRGLQVVDGLIYVTQKEMGVTVIPVPVEAETVKVLSQQEMQITLPSPKFPGSYNLQINNQRGAVVSDGVVVYQ